jgi:hypothetical protein
MDEFGDDVITEIQRNHVEEIHIHGIVRKDHRRDLIDTPMFQVEFRDGQVMNECVFADRRNHGEDTNGKY